MYGNESRLSCQEIQKGVIPFFFFFQYLEGQFLKACQDYGEILLDSLIKNFGEG